MYSHAPVTAILASICGLIIIFLSLKVSKLRRKYKSAIGAINNEEYHRKNGALTNFTTTSPIVLILTALAENSWFCWQALAYLGTIYIIARLTHIYSLYHYETKTSRYTLRIIGMVATFGVITILALINLYLAYSTISVHLER